MTEVPSLREGIERAGSAVNLLWKPEVADWRPPIYRDAASSPHLGPVADEYEGWRAEQLAAEETVALSDQSHHMSDTFIEGPDATRLLAACSLNDYESFAVGQAKQFVAVSPRGDFIGDEILLREGEQKYTMTGVPAAQSWVGFHAARGDFDVEMRVDPNTAMRGGQDPVLFRYEIQGPNAAALAERVFGAPMPEMKFFHSAELALDGRTVRAIRHGMTGQPGWELVGVWEDGDYVLNKLLDVGESFGLVRVGSMAYSQNAVASGWYGTATAGIYSGPELEEYRDWLSLFSFEGQYPIHGSFFSPAIEDYYCSPFELGYRRLMKLNHDFIGREALERSKDSVPRQKVTLVFDRSDVARVLGDVDYFVSFGKYRVEADSVLVGHAAYSAHLVQYDTILALALVNNDHAKPGTEVKFVWGEHPGAGTDPNADLGFERIKATVQPVPYNEFARTQYRR